MPRAFYSCGIPSFCKQEPEYILGVIARNNQFAFELKQRNTWLYEINLLRNVLTGLADGGVVFEYSIPRIGARIDTVLLINGVLYVLEFKVGESEYPQHAVDQVMDYALDLKYFHQQSHHLQIVPILICTNAKHHNNLLQRNFDGIYDVLRCNTGDLRPVLSELALSLSDEPIEADRWVSSAYMPTPTIIEAAQALYRGHNVEDISRSDSDAYNLGLTAGEINRVVDYSKQHGMKSICFITGVPGAGKTLAGLNIANARHNFDENEHAVFLSGNGPLVFVLREALARDEYERSGHAVRKSAAKRKAEAFIQNIHHFRNDLVETMAPPIEKVTIFDEAQRAWTREQTAKFMNERGIHDFNLSEPEFLISAMDRHPDWAVIVCLVGGGQEINTGEAGLPAWFEALRLRFSHWLVFVSNRIKDQEYLRGSSFDELVKGLRVQVIEKLHLAVSLRTFRSERVAAFVKALLDVDIQEAQSLCQQLRGKYPVCLTRSLEQAKEWVRKKARGTERYGLIASSGAKRLRTYGIWVQCQITAENWFLNHKDDVRSSYYLEDTATEFDIQGLEIDWSIVAWDADYRMEGNAFVPYCFTGTQWCNVRKEEDQLYAKNAYRVLLTRARQGFVLFIARRRFGPHAKAILL